MMTALAFWAVGILGITARSSYMPAKDSMTMLPLDEDGSGGGAAAEIVQTTIGQFHRYKNEKGQFTEGNIPWNKGKSSWNKGISMSEESKRKLSESKKGQVPWNKGKKDSIAPWNKGKKGVQTHSEEVRRRISEVQKGRVFSEDHRQRLSVALTGENNPNWQNGKSFEPYCHAFNEPLKESIRNRDNRTCVLCGKGEIQNGQRLSVHHIDSDKAQGCQGKSWYLCALCRSCNSNPDTVEKEFLIVTGGRSIQ